MATKCLGIDIGTSSIKVVEVVAHSKSFALNWASEYKLSLNPAHDPEIEILEILREILVRFDPTTTRVAVAVPQNSVALRKKLFPFTERLKILKSLVFELEDELPLPADSTIFEAKILRTYGNQAEILALAAPKASVRTVLQRCVDAGFAPALVSAESLAFSNCFENWSEAPPALPNVAPELEESGPPPTHLRLVLNLGHTQSFLNVYEKRVLLGSRSLTWGGQQIVEAVAAKYNLPFSEALKEVEAKAFILTSKQKDINNIDIRVFSDTITSVVKVLARELQLHILEVKSEFNALTIKLDLTGGVSNLQGLCPFLTQNLEVPVNRIEILDNFANVYFDKTPQGHAKLGVAIGLALETLKKPRNPATNFLRGEFAPQNNFWKVLNEKWGYTAKLAAAAYVAFFAYAYTREIFAENLTYSVEASLNEQARAVARLPKRQSNVRGVEKFLREKRKVMNELRAISGLTEMNSAVEFLKKLSESVPGREKAKIELAKFFVSEDKLQIMGYAENKESVTLMQQALMTLSTDGKIQTISNSYPQKPALLSFGYEVKINRQIAKVQN